MQKLFKIWLIIILILAIIAALIINIESAFFGLFIIPTIIIVSFILILGFFNKNK